MGLNFGKLMKTVLPAAASFIPGPWGAVAGGVLGGLFGGQNEAKLDPLMKRQFGVQQGIQNELLGYAHSAPMSDPMEQIGLANARAQLGAEQGIQRDQLFQSWNPNTDQGHTNDMMMNMTNQQVGQNMDLSSQHILAAMAGRRQALLNASNVANSGANIAGNARVAPSPDLPGLFGNLAQQVAYNNEMKRRGPQGQGANAGNTGGTLTMPGSMNGVGTGQPNGSAGSLNPGAVLGGFRGSFAPGTTAHDKASFLLGEKAKTRGF